MEMTRGTRGLCAGSTLLSHTKLGAGGVQRLLVQGRGPSIFPPPRAPAFVSPWPDSSTPLPELAGASSACNPCGFYLRARARGGEKGGQPSALKEPGKNNRLQLGDRYTMALKKHTAEESLMALPKGKKCLPTCKQELIIEKRAQESVKTICAMRKRLGLGG